MSGRERLERIAELARLELSVNECSELAPQIDRILAYVDQLREVDVTDIEPTRNLREDEDVRRADEPQPSLSRQRTFEGAPEIVDEQFALPRVIPG